jgi:hypothetical protein
MRVGNWVQPSLRACDVRSRRDDRAQEARIKVACWVLGGKRRQVGDVPGRPSDGPSRPTSTLSLATYCTKSPASSPRSTRRTRSIGGCCSARSSRCERLWRSRRPAYALGQHRELQGTSVPRGLLGQSRASARTRPSHPLGGRTVAHILNVRPRSTTSESPYLPALIQAGPYMASGTLVS